ncbi:MAG: VWA domain-containing protein [Thermomicrobiales bacterium]
MVLAIDRSRSMGERGYLLAAKRMALSLASLIDTRFPRDRLDLLAFSSEAEPVSVPDLASLDWERYAVGTNIHDALAAGRRKLADNWGCSARS